MNLRPEVRRRIRRPRCFRFRLKSLGQRAAISAVPFAQDHDVVGLPPIATLVPPRNDIHVTQRKFFNQRSQDFIVGENGSMELKPAPAFLLDRFLDHLAERIPGGERGAEKCLIRSGGQR